MTLRNKIKTANIKSVERQMLPSDGSRIASKVLMYGKQITASHIPSGRGKVTTFV